VRFIYYSLDDPYIHLALAEHIAARTYSINPDEAAAPASSMLWPLLHVPCAGTSFFEFVPLALNILLDGATTFGYTKTTRVALEELPAPLSVSRRYFTPTSTTKPAPGHPAAPASRLRPAGDSAPPGVWLARLVESV
jgi:hypothetical protein